MNNTIKQIQSILKQMDGIWRGAVGPRRRRDYMHEIGATGIDWQFSLSADDIINRKIPSNVVGPTGRAKVFCKFAAECNLDCVVVCTANYADWCDARAGGNNIINGHQIIAINTDGKLRAFDPGYVADVRFINADIQVGNTINFGHRGAPFLCVVTAIVPRDDFANVDTYQKLRDLYIGK